MNCDNKVITKIIVGRCREYSFFGFRFGPNIFIKIEITYHSCGKFTASIIEGKQIKNFEKVFKKEIEETQQEIVRDLTFAIRRKNIIKQHEEKKKLNTPKSIEELNKNSFDELTTRMRKIKGDLSDHPCLMKKTDVTLKEKEVEIAYDQYFGDTTKIRNRVTRRD